MAAEKTATAEKSTTVETKEKINFDAIIEYGKEKGHLTFDEINERIPDNVVVTAADFEQLYESLDQLEIPVREDDLDFEEDEKKPPAKADKAAPTAAASGAVSLVLLVQLPDFAWYDLRECEPATFFEDQNLENWSTCSCPPKR